MNSCNWGSDNHRWRDSRPRRRRAALFTAQHQRLVSFFLSVFLHSCSLSFSPNTFPFSKDVRSVCGSWLIYTTRSHRCRLWKIRWETEKQCCFCWGDGQTGRRGGGIVKNSWTTLQLCCAGYFSSFWLFSALSLRTGQLLTEPVRLVFFCTLGPSTALTSFSLLSQVVVVTSLCQREFRPFFFLSRKKNQGIKISIRYLITWNVDIKKRVFLISDNCKRKKRKNELFFYPAVAKKKK